MNNVEIPSSGLRVGLYFGSFNPVHNGHLSLAQHLLAEGKVDEVWFVVSPCNPLKQQSDLIDHHIRLEMLQLAVDGNPSLKVSDIEFSMPVPSYTVDTLKKFSSLYPSVQFSLLIGSDNALLFDKWKDYKKILADNVVWVYPRPGYDFALVKGRYPEMRLLDTPFYDVSSTEIRKKIAEKEDVSGDIPPVVYVYIQDHGLYNS